MPQGSSVESLANAERTGSCLDALDAASERDALVIPDYLRETYGWAYLNPASIWLFERDWVVNLILWGNMRRLTDAVLVEIDPQEADGPSLQVACVYGGFSARLAAHLRERDSHLHIVDVAPIQIRNAREKLAGHSNASFHVEDSSALRFRDGQFARTVVFFLLHEQPAPTRRDTIREAIRVTRPGGKVIFVDYHLPRRRNPLRYLMRPVLRALEPFALDLWRTPIEEMLPVEFVPRDVRAQYYCGALYQKVVITR